MANDGTGTLWDETDPADAAILSDGAKQIRDVRKAVKIRLDKEHVAIATASAGGEHKAGSVKAYYGGAAPTLRPDGVTALNADDAGRIWIDGTVVKTWSGAAWVASTGISAGLATAVIKQQVAQGTGGGSFTLGAWRTRAFNTEHDPSGIVTLASNKFTLAAGTYFISASLPAYKVNMHQGRLYNDTDASTVLWGTSEMSAASSNTAQSHTLVIGTFTIAGSKAFELQHRCETSNTSDGFGRAAHSWGQQEVFSTAQIIKLS